MSADPLDAVLRDTMPVLEEMADACETITRSVRAINLLMGARVDPEILTPHFATAMAGFAQISLLHPRLDAIVKKYGA